MKQSYIEIKNYTKSIKGNLVLNNINLKLDRGIIYGFKGKNGSGKTMLFRAISGLIKSTSGSVIVDGKVIGEDIAFPQNLGILIEQPGFLPYFTGYENLKFLADIKRNIGDEEINNSLKTVGLNPNDKRKFKKYSLGMKQRLGIAQAIMEDPDILILDEPTNALDADGVILVHNILRRLKEKNKIILIANHGKDELESICDEIYTIEDGSIIGHDMLKDVVC